MSMPSAEPTEPDTRPANEPEAAGRPPPRTRGSDRAAMILEASGMRRGAAEPAEGSQPGTPRNPEPEPLAPRTGWTLITLIPHDGKEPPADLADGLAQATWCAVSAPWHPSLLSRAAELPSVEPIETPTSPGAREIRIVAAGTLDRLPSGYRTQAEDAGAIVLEAGTDRATLIRQIQERLGAVGTPETSDDAAMIAVADDFLALGTTRWLLRDLAIAMGHEGAINQQA